MAISNVRSGQTYETIQAAVNDAKSGDTIEIAAGTYAGDVTLQKDLFNGVSKTLKFVGVGDVIITGKVTISKKSTQLWDHNVDFEHITFQQVNEGGEVKGGVEIGYGQPSLFSTFTDCDFVGAGLDANVLSIPSGANSAGSKYENCTFSNSILSTYGNEEFDECTFDNASINDQSGTLSVKNSTFNVEFTSDMVEKDFFMVRGNVSDKSRSIENCTFNFINPDPENLKPKEGITWTAVWARAYNTGALNLSDCEITGADENVDVFCDAGGTTGNTSSINATGLTANVDLADAAKGVANVTIENVNEDGSKDIIITDKTGESLLVAVDDQGQLTINAEKSEGENFAALAADYANKAADKDYPVYVLSEKGIMTGYDTLAEASAAASAGEKIIVSSDNTAPIAASVKFNSGETVITGNAVFDWSSGWFYVGDAADGEPVTVTFRNAEIAAAHPDGKKEGKYISTGFNIRQPKIDDEVRKGSYGVLNIDDSMIVTNYFQNSNIVNVYGNDKNLTDDAEITYGYGESGEANLSSTHGFWVQGRAANETVTGEDETAELNLHDGAYVKIAFQDGMGVGFDEGNGIVLIDNSKLEFVGNSNALNIGTKGTVKMQGKSVLEVNDRVINNGVFTVSGESTINGGIEDEVVKAATFSGDGALIFDNAVVDEKIAITGSQGKIKFLGNTTINDVSGLPSTNTAHFGTALEADAKKVAASTITLNCDYTNPGTVLIGSGYTEDENGVGAIKAANAATTLNIAADKTLTAANVTFTYGAAVNFGDNAMIDADYIAFNDDFTFANAIVKNGNFCYGGLNKETFTLTIEDSIFASDYIHDGLSDNIKFDVQGESILSLSGLFYDPISVTMDYTSVLAVDTVENLTAITVDTEGYTAGSYKLVDVNALYNIDEEKYTVAGSANMTVDKYKAMLGDSWNDNMLVLNNDLYLTDLTTDTLYVNSAYAEYDQGTILDDGKIVGINAFDKVGNALATANDLDGAKVEIIESSNEMVNDGLTGNRLTASGLYTISGSAAQLPAIWLKGTDITLQLKDLTATVGKIGDETTNTNTKLEIDNSVIKWVEYQSNGWLTFKATDIAITNSYVGARGDVTDKPRSAQDVKAAYDAGTYQFLTFGNNHGHATGITKSMTIKDSTYVSGFFDVRDRAEVTVTNSVLYLGGGLHIGWYNSDGNASWGSDRVSPTGWSGTLEGDAATMKITDSIVRNIGYGDGGNQNTKMQIGGMDAHGGSLIIENSDFDITVEGIDKISENIVIAGGEKGGSVSIYNSKFAANDVTNDGTFTVSGKSAFTATEVSGNGRFTIGAGEIALNIGALKQDIYANQNSDEDITLTGTVVNTGKRIRVYGDAEIDGLRINGDYAGALVSGTGAFNVYGNTTITGNTVMNLNAFQTTNSGVIEAGSVINTANFNAYDSGVNTGVDIVEAKFEIKGELNACSFIVTNGYYSPENDDELIVAKDGKVTATMASSGGVGRFSLQAGAMTVYGYVYGDLYAGGGYSNIGEDGVSMNLTVDGTYAAEDNNNGKFIKNGNQNLWIVEDSSVNVINGGTFTWNGGFDGNPNYYGPNNGVTNDGTVTISDNSAFTATRLVNNGTISITDSTFAVDDTLTNNGTFTISGASTLTITSLTGEKGVVVLNGATLNDSTISGGDFSGKVNVTSESTISGGQILLAENAKLVVKSALTIQDEADVTFASAEVNAGITVSGKSTQFTLNTVLAGGATITVEDEAVLTLTGGTYLINGVISLENGNLSINGAEFTSSTGELKMDHESTVTFSNTGFLEDGTLTVDVEDATSFYKLFDYVGQEEILTADYYKDLLGSQWNDNFIVNDSDLFYNAMEVTDLYVNNTDWEGSAFGTEVATGKFYGINAFSNSNDALVKANELGGKITIDVTGMGSDMLDGYTAKLNNAGTYTITGGDGKTSDLYGVAVQNSEANLVFDKAYFGIGKLYLEPNGSSLTVTDSIIGTTQTDYKGHKGWLTANQGSMTINNSIVGINLNNFTDEEIKAMPRSAEAVKAAIAAGTYKYWTNDYTQGNNNGPHFGTAAGVTVTDSTLSTTWISLIDRAEMELNNSVLYYGGAVSIGTGRVDETLGNYDTNESGWDAQIWWGDSPATSPEGFREGEVATLNITDSIVRNIGGGNGDASAHFQVGGRVISGNTPVVGKDFAGVLNLTNSELCITMYNSDGEIMEREGDMLVVKSNGTVNMTGSTITVGSLKNSGEFTMDINSQIVWRESLTVTDNKYITVDLSKYDQDKGAVKLFDFTGDSANAKDADFYKGIIGTDIWTNSFYVGDGETGELGDLYYNLADGTHTIDGTEDYEAIPDGTELIVVDPKDAELNHDNTNLAVNGIKAVVKSGTFNDTISGGAVASSSDYKEWDADGTFDTNLTVEGGTFNKIVMGGTRVDKGNSELTGNCNLTITGGTFNSQVVGGMTYADLSADNLRGQAILTGDVNLTIEGGTFKKWIYGGSVANGGPNANNYQLSYQTQVYGDITITVDASQNDITFGENEGIVIVAGSYGQGRVSGDTKVVFTGSDTYLKEFGADDTVWGGSSADVYKNENGTRTFQTAVIGDRIFTFDDFEGEFGALIRGFNTLEVLNGSDVTVTNANLDDIKVWKFDTESKFTGDLGDLVGDTLNVDITDWDQKTPVDLISGDLFSGAPVEGMKVTVTLGEEKETATWSDAISGYASDSYKLAYDAESKYMQFSKLA